MAAPNDNQGAGVVVGLGDPVMDILAHVSHDYLKTITSEPGGCIAVPPEQMAQLLQSAGAQSELKRIPGGSAANVMKGLAMISRGKQPTKFVGMIAKDATGQEYREKLSATGVTPLLLESDSGAPSASAMCLVTPDGQRTMRTCLGASLELRAASQVDPGWLDGLKLLHCEGYCLYRPDLTREMTSAAKAAGALVSIDLASFELVRQCKDGFLSLLTGGHLDLLFANEEEAATLAVELGLTEATAAHEVKVTAAQDFLLQYIQVSIVSMGPRGCVVRARDGRNGASDAAKVKVVDTIGAGDCFTAGFLYAFMQGAELPVCAAAGCAAGAEAVQAEGAILPPEAVTRLTANIDTVLAQAQAGTSVSGAHVDKLVHITASAH